ncbi:phospho-N-acetylmuramoyl-pentapeptide-transferase [Effusibacillus lacus]|uniref:Phospho-N-acetylmuramoyl-pentapeptide-transferase n=1 Tax=Effusibacillus lacus TaxID=1348429 RepID=A0A292YQ28_9BACL|nr:phospho-N-acetylmuramoyl-pentapeptide-transferase [Effusibacillus lacus]TCS75688.1 phospho-N-acetylmuramoyl-pentapeptide-transferase [Effusibacillus lacus]GAX91009.1 phospho-N-acetylmuramoyl-pentapeptide-transferase [Effusibacillus lacus]
MELQALFWTAGVAFLIAVVIGPLFIPVLRRLKFGQAIRSEGPQGHQKKAGTPTMGGTIFLVALAITSIQFSDRSSELWLLLLVTLGFGLVGFLDDYIKVVMKRNLGLRARQKLLGQILVSAIFFAVLYIQQFDFSVSVPFTDSTWDLGLLYAVFLFLVLIGTTNGVNLTDGLDGLAAGTSAIAFATYALIAAVWSSQFDVAIFCAAMAGALLGFLVFNAHPAKVFMGDTGSLALGGGLAAAAILTKTELLLVLIGFVFVAETLSVLIQVFSFQVFGKRVFKMSPLHHHFELSGWSEWRVVATFWAAGLACSMAALSAYF